MSSNNSDKLYLCSSNFSKWKKLVNEQLLRKGVEDAIQANYDINAGAGHVAADPAAAPPVAMVPGANKIVDQKN